MAVTGSLMVNNSFILTHTVTPHLSIQIISVFRHRHCPRSQPIALNTRTCFQRHANTFHKSCNLHKRRPLPTNKQQVADLLTTQTINRIQLTTSLSATLFCAIVWLTLRQHCWRLASKPMPGIFVKLQSTSKMCENYVVKTI